MVSICKSNSKESFAQFMNLFLQGGIFVNPNHNADHITSSLQTRLCSVSSAHESCSIFTFLFYLTAFTAHGQDSFSFKLFMCVCMYGGRTITLLFLIMKLKKQRMLYIFLSTPYAYNVVFKRKIYAQKQTRKNEEEKPKIMCVQE